MKGINKVIISGNVLANIEFGAVPNGAEAASFQVASDRYGSGGIVTAYVKVNVYGDDLVKSCRAKLVKGVYVLVEGELMNRHGQHGDNMIEVRAKEIIFLPKSNAGSTAGGTNHESGSRQQQE